MKSKWSSGVGSSALSVCSTLAAFVFEVHLADAPGEAEADEARVVAPTVVFGIVGVGGDGVRIV